MGLNGYGWNLDVCSWKFEYILILRRDISKGDKDDFIVLKCFID